MNGWLDPGNPGGQFMQPRSYGANEAGKSRAASTTEPGCCQNALFARYGVAPGVVGNTSEFRFNEDGPVFVTQKGLWLQRPVELFGPGGLRLLTR